MERKGRRDGGGPGERHHQHERPRGKDCGGGRRLWRGETGRETAGNHESIDGRRRRGVRAADDEGAIRDDETRGDEERTPEERETDRHEHRHGDGDNGGEDDGDGDGGGGKGSGRKTGRKRDDGRGGRGHAEGDKRRDRRRERRRDDRGRFADAIDETDILDVFEAVDGPVVTTTDVADVLGVTTEAARQRLNGLVQDGHLRRRKTGRTVVYWRTDR